MKNFPEKDESFLTDEEKKKKDQSNFMLGLTVIGGLILGFPMVVFIGCLIRAFVISQLWAWYFVPFFGVAALPLAIAFGFSLLAGFLSPTNHAKDERSVGAKLGFVVLYPTFVLLLGWIGSWFV